MHTAHPEHPIIAIVYPKGSDFEAFLQEITVKLAAQGLRLAGLVQHSRPKPGRTTPSSARRPARKAGRAA